MVFFLFLICTVLLEVDGNGMPGTAKNLDTQFINKCETYKKQIRPVNKNCKQLLTTFKNIWVGKDPCKVSRAAYRPFTTAASVTIPPGKSLFWSGSKVSAQKFSQRGWNAVTLETSFIGNLLDGLVFCGKLKTKEDQTGINYKECPGWMSCTDHAMKSFWGAASQWFAESARGHIKVLIGGWRKPAFAPTSIFASIELPALKTGKSGVTKVDVWMENEKLSNCKEASMLQMKKAVEAKIGKGTFICYDNPKLDQRSANKVKLNPIVKGSTSSFIKSSIQK